VGYGLSAETNNLPGFIVLTSTGKSGQQQPIASRQWSAGFLPSKYQGVRFYSKGDAVHYINNPAGVSPSQQRDVLDAVERLNRIRDESVDDPEIATRISQYEIGLSNADQRAGIDGYFRRAAARFGDVRHKGSDGSFAANCLLARRLAERGVRFIQLYHRDWDHHGGIRDGHQGHFWRSGPAGGGFGDGSQGPRYAR